MTDFFDVLKKSECEFEENKNIAQLTSSRISAVARAVAYPNSEENLVELINRLNDIDAKYVVVGRMTNVLIRDGKYNGVIIRTTKIRKSNVAENTVTFSCGSGIAGIVQKLAIRNLGGMEGIIGIPGSVGGMVKQNAGAFGYEISDRFKSCTCYIPTTQSICDFNKEDMNFSYRNSKICHINAIILSATFELIEKRHKDIVEEIADYKVKRRTTQPIEEPSLGSVFKRYNGISAGYYIDMSGLKGYSIGGACVSTKHAGFIINKEGATAKDYLKLIEYIKNKVYSIFKIELQEEIDII